MYSTIKPKIGRCIDCSITEPPKRLVAGRCPYHYKNFRSRVSTERQKENNQDASFEATKRQEWFRARVMEMTGFCAECKAPTSKYNFKYAICSVAHILPKSIFKSVEFHPLNWMELGAQCGCHSRSEVWSNATEMKVWGEMVARFRLFVDDIAEDERKYVPALLMAELEKAPVETGATVASAVAEKKITSNELSRS